MKRAISIAAGIIVCLALAINVQGIPPTARDVPPAVVSLQSTPQEDLPDPAPGESRTAGAAIGYPSPAPMASPTPPLPPRAAQKPYLGLYESCLPAEADCQARLAAMAAKGFTIVLNDGLRYAPDAASIRAYADLADRLGMKVILPVKYSPDWDAKPAFLPAKFPELAQACRCKDNPAFLSYYVSILIDHPALWGYYIADEVHPEFSAGLNTYADLIHKLDPKHPRLIVEEGTNDPMEIFHTFTSSMRTTTEVIGVDNYPYGYIDLFDQLTSATGESARITQAWADKLGLQSAVVLQAFSWTQYPETIPLCMPWPACAPFPSYDQLKAQRDQALLQANPAMILWFSYPDILASDNPTKHWADLAAAALAPLPTPALVSLGQPQICPQDWTCEDIGSPSRAGAQTLAQGRWTVSGSGWDIWSHAWVRADQFHYVWQGLSADGALSARLVSQASAHPQAKAGLMLRQTYDPTAPFYAILATFGDGLHVQYRPAFNQDPFDLVRIPAKAPLFFKITRKGSTFQAFTSSDGANWSLVPHSTMHIPALTGTLMAGLAVTSHDTEAIFTATFDHLYLSTP